MHGLNQMDTELYSNVLRKQSEVWTDLATALGRTWRRALSPAWTVEVEISMDEILADLSYGRE